jgi:dGTPase
VNHRERLEALEEDILAPYAAHSKRTAGRERPEAESPVRTAYQRDRDRIIHANAFRRLRGKTQVFIAVAGDHYATRLSHALEVAQVARDIARALRLNEDLAEAIALAHDLGHAPFGHAGQKALNQLLGEGYQHDKQSLRVVRFIEKNGQGLNLTAEVVDGIRTHRKPRHSLAGTTEGPSATLEAEVVKLADAIAYINHDVDDAVRAGIISESDLPPDALERLGNSRSQRINTAVCDILETSDQRPIVAMNGETLAALDTLRDYLFQHVYTNQTVKRESSRAEGVVFRLFEFYWSQPDKLPPEYQEDVRGEGTDRRVADYIAGMTDAFAIAAFEDLFVPKTWPARG